MGYTKRNRTPLALSGVTDVALAAASVVQDPCLYDVATLLLKLNQLEQQPVVKVPTLPGAPVPPPPPPVKGIGLCKAVGPLKAVVYVRQNPLVGIAAAAGIVGAIFALGYLAGKGGRR